MVAKITTPKSINRALNYNEQKVKLEKAECLYAGNFLQEANELNFYQKFKRFEHQNALNQRAKTNTLHVSLNFDAEDKISREKLIEIATGYMEKIGFGEQPYLVYQHHDAGHAHLHIVTTSIQKDGRRINTFNIGKNESERARKSLELEYNLVRAESKKQEPKKEQVIKNSVEDRMVTAQKVQYGKMETRRSIQNVLDVVVEQYKYSSLAELNAVLKQYNVMADRGKENSIVYQKGGLYYRALDENGNKIGVPIKASLFHQKPTLYYLEQKFQQNLALKQVFRNHIRVFIDWSLHGKSHTLASFEKDLQKESIKAVIRRNEQGIVYGMTYIDFKNKVVFNGSDLGKEYSAKALIERMAQRIVQNQKPSLLPKREGNYSQLQRKTLEQPIAGEKEKIISLDKAIDLVLKPVESDDYVPSQLMPKKRKRKKRSQHL